jgi:hypothetical protein
MAKKRKGGSGPRGARAAAGQPVAPGPTAKAVPGVPGCRWRESAEKFTDKPNHPLYYDVVFER